jgi:hypothetical protein
MDYQNDLNDLKILNCCVNFVGGRRLDETRLCSTLLMGMAFHPESCLLPETGGKRFSPPTTLVQWLGSFEFAK